MGIFLKQSQLWQKFKIISYAGTKERIWYRCELTPTHGLCSLRRKPQKKGIKEYKERMAESKELALRHYYGGNIKYDKM